MGKTTIVCGPPGAGKSTYARQQMGDGDMLIDLDDIKGVLSSRPGHQCPASITEFAIAAMEAVIDALSRPNTVPHVWLVTCKPHREERATLARELDAEVVVLAVPVIDCMRHLKADDTRINVPAWVGLADKWWKDYRPNEGDRVLRDW